MSVPFIRENVLQMGYSIVSWFIAYHCMVVLRRNTSRKFRLFKISWLDKYVALHIGPKDQNCSRNSGGLLFINWYAIAFRIQTSENQSTWGEYFATAGELDV